jgi:hypothetical protein
MSHPKTPPHHLFFVALTGRVLDLWKKVLDELKSELGSVLFQSKVYDFSSFTSYYEKEMGEDLKKAIYFFERLKPPEYIVELKCKCYEIEKKFTDYSGKRMVNIDPGYLGLSKIVLSTFKDYAHRIYLGKGVYAEVTLIYKNKTYTELPWTYPDYKQTEIIEFFNTVRTWYKEKLNVN